MSQPAITTVDQVPTEPSPYPESEKHADAAPYIQRCREFVEWLASEKKLVLSERDPEVDRYYPAGVNLAPLLAEFFEIDENALEQERHAMLDALRGE